MDHIKSILKTTNTNQTTTFTSYSLNWGNKHKSYASAHKIQLKWSFILVNFSLTSCAKKKKLNLKCIKTIQTQQKCTRNDKKKKKIDKLVSPKYTGWFWMIWM